MVGGYEAGDDRESLRTLPHAIELGITFVDAAEMYGSSTNEESVGRAIADRRDKVVVCTKFVITFDRTTMQTGTDGGGGSKGIGRRPALRRHV